MDVGTLTWLCIVQCRQSQDVWGASGGLAGKNRHLSLLYSMPDNLVLGSCAHAFPTTLPCGSAKKGVEYTRVVQLAVHGMQVVCGPWQHLFPLSQSWPQGIWGGRGRLHYQCCLHSKELDTLAAYGSLNIQWGLHTGTVCDSRLC